MPFNPVDTYKSRLRDLEKEMDKLEPYSGRWMDLHHQKIIWENAIEREERKQKLGIKY